MHKENLIFLLNSKTKATITKDKKGNPTQFSMGISITLKINTIKIEN